MEEPIKAYMDSMQAYQSKAHYIATICQLTREIENAHRSADELKKLVDQINLNPEILQKI